MALPDYSMRQLLEAGVHFGHQSHRWNPKMAEYIFGARNNIHILDLAQTVPMMHRALQAVSDTVAKGGRILIVGTKRQAQDAIADAAKEITREHNMGLVLNLDEIPQKISAGIKYNLVHIVQEAVVNAAKHSGAATIEVSLAHAGNELRLSISDHGCGMKDVPTGDAKSHHYGIIGMKERAAQVGGEVFFFGLPGRGTTVTLRIPLPAVVASNRGHP